MILYHFGGEIKKQKEKQREVKRKKKKIRWKNNNVMWWMILTNEFSPSLQCLLNHFKSE